MAHAGTADRRMSRVVLVVEDEPLQRMMAMAFIRAAGWEALEAASADQAIAVLERREDIAVVFTDIDLATGWDGVRLANHVRGRWPPVAFIVTSGNTGVEALQLPEGSRFFPKPYRRGDVLRALEHFIH